MRSLSSRTRLSVLLCSLLVPLAAAHAQDNPQRRQAEQQHREADQQRRQVDQQRRQVDQQRRQVDQQRRMDQARQRERDRVVTEQRRRDWEAERRRQYDNRRWSQGQYLPRAYWDRRYYVPDWQVRHLPPPMVGYQWVYIDGQYVLMQIDTGLIVRILLP
ncbi:MAG TPA: RcnB family protein [Bordetella sp.]